MEGSLEFSNNLVNSMQGMQGFMSSRRVRRKDQIFQIVKIKNKKKWTKEEDNLLIRLAESHREKHWKDISKHFVNKNALQCFSRYKRIRPGIVKGAWGREEDEKIMRLVQIYGKAWSKISKVLVTRNGKQIRDRFINVLDPEIKKGKFTEEEDKTLIALYMHYGPKWATIAKHFLNRTADMIKNRFHSSIKKMFYNTPSNTIKRSAFLGKKLEQDPELTNTFEGTTHKNSMCSNSSYDHNALLTNPTTNSFSFSFNESKGTSPKNIDTSFHSQVQHVLDYSHSQNIPKVNLNPHQETNNISEMMKYDNLHECQDYREYVNPLNPLGQADDEIHNNMYDDNDLLLKFDDDMSFRNSNIFNFDEYFTV